MGYGTLKKRGNNFEKSRKININYILYNYTCSICIFDTYINWNDKIGGIFALLGLIGIFSFSNEGEDVKTGLAIKNDNGTVYITKETFENIILGITKNYPELKNVKVEINVSEEGVSTNIFAYILPDTILPELTSKVQNNIKSGVKKQTTVEIKEANIKVKGVYFEQSKQQNSK